MIADGTLIYGVGDTDEKAKEDHDRNLKALFQRARKVGLKFNKHKLQLCLKEVKYMGHVISDRGVRSDPAKVKAIL